MNFKFLLPALLLTTLIWSSSGNAAEPIVLGLSAPLTGPMASSGQRLQEGAQLHVDQINARGGVGGRPLTLISEDDRSSPLEAASVAQKLSNTKNLVAAFGPFTTTASLAAAPIYTKAKIPQVAPTTSGPDFTKQGGYQFRQNNRDDYWATKNVEILTKRFHAKKVILVAYQDDWGIFMAKATRAILEKQGVEVVLDEPIAPGSRDFRPLVSKIRSAQADAIFLATFYTEGATFIQQLRQAGVQLPVGGAIPLTDPKFIELAGPASEGIVLYTLFFAGDPTKKVFVDAYKGKYGRAPDPFSALSYDAVGVTVAAIERVLKAGTPLNGQAVHDQLVAGPVYHGITGDTKFDNGDVKKEPVFIQIKNGAFALAD
jgi:branched-chain amino acid transport system substrate-binding protein